MNTFDYVIVTYINQFSQQSLTFDKLLILLSGNHLLKGGVLVIIIWWAWFKNDDHHPLNRKHIILILISCIAAIAFARGLALTSPFRLRPLYEKGLNFLLPYGMSPTCLDGWSSFPSDHAALFFALSTGLLFTSRRAGTFSLIYTTLFISFPRIYLGLHYPTDIIAGAIIGIIFALLSNIYLINNTCLQSIANWSYSKPSFYYPLFFLFTYQIADLFDSSRAIISAGFNFFLSILGLSGY